MTLTASHAPTSRIRIERRSDVLHLTIDHPAARNAMDAAMVAELASVVAGLATDPARAVVIRGAGGVFCSGGDIGRFAQDARTEPPRDGADPVAAANRRFGHLLQALDAAPQVIIAVVEGPAFGGGFGLACASDIVLVRADARFSLSETTLGVIPAQIAPFVARRLGVTTARRLALTAARFDGAAAVSLGVADMVFEDAVGLDAGLAEVLASIAKCAPRANGLTKRLFADCATEPVETLLDRAAAQFAAALRDEGREGADAFLAKRRPAWTGESQ